jgi:IclR family acetate operon transcriptional repressor
MNAKGRGDGSVRAILRALDILDALHAEPSGLSLAHIASAAGLPKSSALRYLSTLESRGYVERSRVSRRYALGPALLPIRARRLEELRRRAHPHLDELRKRFGETINLGVLDGNRVAYIEILESPHSMRLAPREGDREPLHSTALGKAIATQLSEADVRAILAVEGMPQLTVRTITSRERFLSAVAETLARGYALDNGENEEGGRCVAVPFSLDGLVAAISLSAPAMRFSLEQVEPVAAALIETARALGHRDAREVSASSNSNFST